MKLIVSRNWTYYIICYANVDYDCLLLCLYNNYWKTWLWTYRIDLWTGLWTGALFNQWKMIKIV